MAKLVQKRRVELPAALHDAFRDIDGDAIAALLEQHPEWRSSEFTFEDGDHASGKHITGGLLSAAMRLTPHHINELLEVLVEDCGIGFEIHTSFYAGSSRLLWSGPAIHDAICSGSLEAVRYLLDHDADPRSGSTFGDAQGATALWQAAFNGYSTIVSLLLDRSAAYDIETTSPWQDRPEHLLTPLHVAARMGHDQVVEVLIETGAQYDTRRLQREGGSSPLRDAIQRCHVAVVKLLVQRDATVPRKALFEINNEVTIAAVAEGLTQASKQAVKGCLLPVEWLGMFLRTPGHAPAHILNAIFQCHSLKYFDFENQRQDANMAHFENGAYLNVKEGMPFEEFNSFFVQRQQLGKDGLRLLRGLGVEVARQRRRTAGPSQDEVERYEHDIASSAQVMKHLEETNQRSNFRLQRQGSELVVERKSRSSYLCFRSGEILQFDSLMNNRTFMAPARVLQCILPDVLNNEYVLYAIAHASNEDIFEFHGCQAIISLGWSQAWLSATVDSVLSISLAILFAVITIFLSRAEPASAFGFVLLGTAAVLVTVNLLKELCLMQGMFLLGKLRQYWFQVGNSLDWCRLVLSYMVLAFLALEPEQWQRPSSDLSVLLAVTALFRWGDVLTTFRGYQWVGEKVLPIERALLSSRTFGAIVMVACCAFTNAYVALGLSGSESIFHSFFVIYRLGFLSDLEHRVWNSQDEDPARDMAAVLGIFTALIMTVVMMNIFIGILSESYAQAYRNRHLSFQRERSRIAFAHSVRKRAYDAWRNCCCACYRKEADDSLSKYLWYSVKQTQEHSIMPRQPKQRVPSAGRRMSAVLKGLLHKRPSAGQISNESSPVSPVPRLRRKQSQTRAGPASHAAPPVGEFQAVLPAVGPPQPPRQAHRGEHEGSDAVVSRVPGMVQTPTPPQGGASPAGDKWERILSSAMEETV